MGPNEEILVVVDDNATDTDTNTNTNTNTNTHIHIPSSPSPSSCNQQGSNQWGTLSLAYKSLGVVFGGLVTSPLYVYPSMALKSPTKDDYMGIYSIMFWTLTLIGVVKYACIALKADDQGEGGTFALYSLLCRHMNIGAITSRSVALQSNLSHDDLHQGSKRRSRLGMFIERSLIARRVLFFIAILGMCMLIGDGILTPAISVLSAMDGIRGPFPEFSKSLIGALSALVLIVLFMLQKFGTARVSFLFSPIMGVWTLTTPIIGIYNVIRHYPSIFKAISPHYIFQFFWRNGHEGWLLLNGTILCITGSEALFADLGHFDRPSIQITFLSLIYPSLILTYAGQTAYLIQHPNDHEDGFYKFIPREVYWPMFVISSLAAIVASQSLISATFSVIKQSVVLDYFPRIKIVHTSSSNEGQVYSPETNYALMVFCVAVILIFGDGKEIGNAFGVVIILVMLITTLLLTLVMIVIWRIPAFLVALFSFVFLTIEGLYVSSVFTKIKDGGWIPFAISLILAFIMFGWFYGRQRKMEYELTHKINTERLKSLLSDPGVQRVPGLCFFYTNIQDGFTPVLSHYIKNMRSIHKVTVFTTLRYLLVPKVAPNKRIVVKGLGLKGAYGCLIQYGYADLLSLQGDFVSQVIASLQDHIMQQFTENPPLEEQEMTDLNEAQHAAVVHVRGKTRFYISKKCTWFDRFMLAFYEFMHSNCRSALPTLGVPLQQRIEVGMFYEA
ncbi:probable potassium transporter 17 isoform X1 [Cynara cardunculus var. scolymus]|uniref:probable potassium transporter 17 isoform X1 n=2 Tax=Cynara cardunculus var. scolymus TaxID=59895 RepID=UPI000D62BE04|nr:probable potassium transporter 17 isoform X1 [Cynara cardunculus var. scolymus]